MSARFPSRWLLAVVVLVAAGLTALAQSPAPPSDPKVPGVPQTAPPAVAPLTRLLVEPLLLEQEQVSEHCDRLAPVTMPRPAPGQALPLSLPPADEILLRCLLFSIHPLAAFLPIQIGTTELPPPDYAQHPPLYMPPSPVVPCPVERLPAMPTEVDRIKVMPASEESEPKYELLRPWTDDAQLRMPRALPTEMVASTPVPAPLRACQAGACPADCPQVQVDILIAEVMPQAARKLKLYHVTDTGAPRWVIEVADEARGKALVAGLQAEHEKGRAKLLAMPKLVTLSGEQCNFLSGGVMAVPTPVTSEPGCCLRFEEFGTRLNCRPTAQPDGRVHLDVEPEISELCQTAGVTVQGVAVPGRSTQRVHTTADLPPGHALVISGPKVGSTRLVVMVTPTIIKPTTETGATGLMPERVHGVVSGGYEDFVHDLLVKCQRELSRSHFAAAEDLAQQALLRDRKAVMADPLVCQSQLLQRVKAIAVLPLGNVSPCEAKGEGPLCVTAAESKPIGSDQSMTDVLMQEYTTAYGEGRYTEAAVFAQRALQIDPDNAVAAGALNLAWNQLEVKAGPQWRAAQAMTRFRDYFKQGRYEEAQREALSACQAMPEDRNALAALKMACMALAQQPRPADPPQCTYPGSYPRPADPAVVSALQKLLLDKDKDGPVGGSEEAEPKVPSAKMPRR
jgi:tetratricopeptide (TPR) repeat protein